MTKYTLLIQERTGVIGYGIEAVSVEPVETKSGKAVVDLGEALTSFDNKHYLSLKLTEEGGELSVSVNRSAHLEPSHPIKGPVSGTNDHMVSIENNGKIFTFIKN